MAGQGSARVTLREIDLSQVRSQEQLPQGTPAGVIGTAKKGPAFVPQTFATMKQFEETFGSLSDLSIDSNANKFGPLALNEWMRNADAGSYVRVLGAGDGLAATANSVNTAGFTVGQRLVQPNLANPGKIGKNPFASNDSALLGTSGRTHFLGCFTNDKTGSNFFKDAGIFEFSSASITIKFDAVPDKDSQITLISVDGSGNPTQTTYEFLPTGSSPSGSNIHINITTNNTKDLVAEALKTAIEGAQTDFIVTRSGGTLTIKQREKGLSGETQVTAQLASSLSDQIVISGNSTISNTINSTTATFNIDGTFAQFINDYAIVSTTSDDVQPGNSSINTSIIVESKDAVGGNKVQVEYIFITSNDLVNSSGFNAGDLTAMGFTTTTGDIIDSTNGDGISREYFYTNDGTNRCFVKHDAGGGNLTLQNFYHAILDAGAGKAHFVANALNGRVTAWLPSGIGSIEAPQNIPGVNGLTGVSTDYTAQSFGSGLTNPIVLIQLEKGLNQGPNNLVYTLSNTPQLASTTDLSNNFGRGFDDNFVGSELASFADIVFSTNFQEGHYIKLAITGREEEFVFRSTGTNGANIDGKINVLIGANLGTSIGNLETAITSGDSEFSTSDFEVTTSGGNTVKIKKRLETQSLTENTNIPITFNLRINDTVNGTGSSSSHEAAKNTNFTGANLSPALPVIRGILMSPQGVKITLEPGDNLNNQVRTNSNEDLVRAVNTSTATFGTAEGSLEGYILGKVTNQAFTILLNGFTNQELPAKLVCSFDPDSNNYFAKVLNTDPTKIEECGHYLYSNWDLEKELAEPNSRNLEFSHGSDLTAFCVANERDLSDPTSAFKNYEDFTSRFRTSRSPWVTSQVFDGDQSDRTGLTSSSCYKLFKLHALDDGEIGHKQYRVLVSNISLGIRDNFGSFNLALEEIGSDPVSGNPLIEWRNINLDPDSRNFIGRIIGDEHTYWDFDKDESKQRLVTKGTHPLRNKYVRVEIHPDVFSGEIPRSSLPTGFQGPGFIKTNDTGNFAEPLGTPILQANTLDKAQILPYPMVKSISRLAGSSIESTSRLAWGVKFGIKKGLDAEHAELTEQQYNRSLSSWMSFYPDIGSNPVFVEGTDACDTFHNNFFSLEKIHVTTSGDDKISTWDNSEYRRDGSAGSRSRFVVMEKDAKGTNVPYLKFRFFMQGGFDGVNIFDKEKAELSGVATLREGEDENIVNVFTGPTISSYNKAIDVLKDKTSFDLQLLALPGIRSPQVTNYAIDACEERFDAMLIMDIEEVDDSADRFLITSKEAEPSALGTVNRFLDRELDSSFAAAYFPDVISTKPSDRSSIVVPPSVVMLGAISLNDRLADPWFAPAGLTRGRLNASDSRLRMPRSVLDQVYDADINPIYVPAGRSGEVFTFGQKTLLRDQSSLDRINVRRLLINLRRKVKKVAERLLFEPNRETTLQRFSQLVEPIMSNVQARRGVTRYKVQIDTNTTTQNDIENNTIRGKIYLQPTKSVEFISLDFVVTNSINE